MKKNIVPLIISAVIIVSGLKISAENTNFSEPIVNMDINGDNKFNCADIVIAKNQMFGTCLVNTIDVNNDGVFNILDFIAMKEKLITVTDDSIKYSSQWEDSLICYENLKARSSTDAENFQTNSKIYSKEELLKSISYYSTFNRVTQLSRLNEKFPIDKFIAPENAMPYCVYSLDTGEKMYVFFEDFIGTVRLVTAVFIVSDMIPAETFNSLKPGMTLADVEKIDSGTKYMDSVRNFPLYSKESLHMVKDGFIKITYNFTKTDSTFTPHNPVPTNPAEFIIEKTEYIPNGDVISLWCQQEYIDFRIKVLDE